MKNQRALKLLALTFAITLAITFSPVLAAKKGGGGKGGGKAAGGAAQPTGPSPQQQAMVADQAAVTAAQADYSKSLVAVTLATNKLRAAFEQNSEWIAAQKQLTDAQGLLTDARKPVIAELGKNSEYAAALEERNKTQADFDALKASPQDATPEALSPLAATLMADNTKLSKLEADALNANPNYTAAKDAVTSAQAVVNALKAKFQDSLASDADYKAAKDISDAAHQKLLDAQAKVASDMNQSTPPAGGKTGAYSTGA